MIGWFKGKKGVILIEITSKNEDQKIDYNQNLYDSIHALQKKFYTYKELTELLKQPHYNGGNQKKRQIKEFERYMDMEYNKKTKKFKIKEKYAVPLPPLSEDPSNTIYAKHVKTLLLNYLLRNQEEGKPIYISSEKLYKALGMINNHYIEYKKADKKQLKNELKAELVINKNYSEDTLQESTIKYYIDDFYSRSGSKIASLLKNSLDTLEKQGYLTSSRAYRIYRYGENPTYSTDAEIEDIMEIERTVMDEFGFETDKDIWFKGQKHEYWKQVLELAQKIDPDIYGLYRCHKIIGIKKNLQSALSREEESREMCELNQKILDFIDTQAENNMHKSYEKNPYDYTKQLSDRYVSAQKYLSSRLIKIRENKESIFSLVVAKYELPEIYEDDPEWFKEEVNE